MGKNEVNGEWTYGDGLYFMWCSITTIGFGDLQPEMNKGKWIQFLMIWLGLCLTVCLIGSIQNCISEKCKKWKRKTKHLSEDHSDNLLSIAARKRLQNVISIQ